MDIHEIKEEILNQFHDCPNKNRAYLLGIDGLSGAGKTTLVNQLESELSNSCNVVVIHMDDHIVERKERYHTGYEEWYEYYFLQWNIDLLTEELFKKVEQNDTNLTLPFYEKSVDQVANKTIFINPNSIILMEGIFLQRKEWKSYFDYTIFVDCPREKRYERVLKRDKYIGDRQAIQDKYIRRYWPGERYYLENEDPVNTADKVCTCIE
ncbi:uridine kinase [Oceanobacillus limi]|uniref:Uridine kinase n=1 Tax=Oceanobacillus limi TaxID=930131 RepID=A0A1H9Y2J8_9BACI|nr:kinase [Oceanobacillus limi]SES63059.1 uridine kinase [Oceanobacillus limi]